jgi:hypothetical protein
LPLARPLKDKEIMDDKEQKTIIENAISYFLRQGYFVNSQTDNSVQLVKPKKFSFLLAIIFLLLSGLPLIIYVLYYLSQETETLYIRVDAQGQVHATNQDGVTSVATRENPLFTSENALFTKAKVRISTSSKVMIGIIVVLVALWLILVVMRLIF